jgi:hypothetical protein
LTHRDVGALPRLQLSDPHIGATWGAGDPAAGLEAVVESGTSNPFASSYLAGATAATTPESHARTAAATASRSALRP